MSCGGTVGSDAVARVLGREVKLGVFPIGIDPKEIQHLLAQPDASEAADTLRRVARGRKTLLRRRPAGLFQRHRRALRRLSHLP